MLWLWLPRGITLWIGLNFWIWAGLNFPTLTGFYFHGTWNSTTIALAEGFVFFGFFFHQKAWDREHPLASSTCYPLQAKQLRTSLSSSKYIYSTSYIFLHYNCFVLLLFLVEILNNILNLKLFSSKKKIKELSKSLCFFKVLHFFFVRYKCIFYG